MKETEQQEQPTLLQRFLWWCAGVDKTLMLQCKHEWAKYASMGATILLTGVLASISGGYALYTVFRNGNLDAVDNDALIPAIAFGILWGTIIFNLDRYIITSFTKSSETNPAKRIGYDLLHATPRIIVALIIAITISKPIEVKMFENRLRVQIETNKKIEQRDNLKDYNDMYGIDRQKQEINQTIQTIDSLQNLKQLEPENVKQMRTEYATFDKNRKQAESNKGAEQIEMNIISSNPNNYEYETDSIGNRYQTNRFTSSARSKYNNHKNKRDSYNKDKLDWERKMKEKENEINIALTEYKNNLNSQISRNDTIRNNQENKLRVTTNLSDSLANNANMSAEHAYTNNFITQLEALGDLKKYTIDETDTEYQIQQKKKKARTFSLISFALTLLFLMIELTPILTKLIIKRGAYDDLLDIENEKIKGMIDADQQIAIRVNEERIKTEVATNSELMSKIAVSQAELLETAIEEWRKAELEKIHADPSKYIQSNTTKG